MPSTATKLTICNMALGFIGTRTLASPNERTPEAIQCELYWDTARRSALRDFPYRFAQRRVVLAEKPLPAVYAMEWRHAYGLPDGWLKIHRVHGGEVGADPWLLVSDGAGIIILSNVAGAMADYSRDVEDVSLWDELFVLAMARKLALLIAVPLLKNNSGKMEELATLYQAAIPQADGQDASEGLEQHPFGRDAEDSWIRARSAW